MKTFSAFLPSLQETQKPKSKLNGISVLSLDAFLKEIVIEDWILEAPFLGATTRPFSPDELQSYLGRIKTKNKEKTDKYNRPFIHGSNIEIKGETGTTYDTDKLRTLITTRPIKITKQNEKMQHSDGTSSVFFNVGLPALKGLAVNEKTGEFVVVDTCPGAGTCKTVCYAMKGGYIQWKASSLGMTRVLNFLLNDPDGFSAMLTQELTQAEAKFAKKGTKVVVRWHDAGDFFSPEYLEVAYKIARKFPTIDFYAYTKIASVAQGNKPDNFKINFSSGAQPSQEKQIDFVRTKHSRIVPKEMFYDLILRNGTTIIKNAKGATQFRGQEEVSEFKRRLANKYALTIDTIISYPEMMAKKVDPDNKWNVYVMPGDGDDGANRKDVLGVYLLIH